MTPLQQLGEHGTSVWIDYLSRRFVKDGDLAGLVDKGVVGVTSNPTIFQGAIASGDAYDDQIRELSADHDDAYEIFWLLARDDIRDACDVLRQVWDEGNGKDGWVSLEVDPRLAYDAKKTAEEAKRLHDLVDRPNLFIKIPATKDGLQAIEETIAAGIPVNVTLIFSLERHREVIRAYSRGVKRFADGGGDPSKLASVASFFVSRVDTEADKRLDKIGGHDELKGKLAIANAKLAYQVFLEEAEDAVWKDLLSKGATPQRPLWASTSTKNPEYRDVMYVEELVGPDTVNTMPRETAEATDDHAVIRGDTILEDVDGAKAIFKAFEEAGIDYDDVVAVLEKEGVEKFEKSFADLIEGLESKLKALVAA
ncbi:transaldolase [Candidatus Solirubrobacter pratensis]|uniref:transaldolase n=1 Tax=Candidatus Solirubrobacter pratensis TaxID=1298857 RepID=UPI00040C90C6|nr:transaldolase [Candidatus Solirubrobacter pratensis]